VLPPPAEQKESKKESKERRTPFSPPPPRAHTPHTQRQHETKRYVRASFCFNTQATHYSAVNERIGGVRGRSLRSWEGVGGRARARKRAPASSLSSEGRTPNDLKKEGDGGEGAPGSLSRRKMTTGGPLLVDGRWVFLLARERASDARSREKKEGVGGKKGPRDDAPPPRPIVLLLCPSCLCVLRSLLRVARLELHLGHVDLGLGLDDAVVISRGRIAGGRGERRRGRRASAEEMRRRRKICARLRAPHRPNAAAISGRVNSGRVVEVTELPVQWTGRRLNGDPIP
jgi:hypothetical protein